MRHQHLLYVKPLGPCNGTNVTFALPSPPQAGSVRIFINGLEQLVGHDYSVSGSTITLVVPPKPGDVIFAHYTRGLS